MGHFLLLAIIMLITLTACATPSTLLVNQEGRVQRCAAHGWGYVGAPMAGMIHSRCVEDL